MRWGRSRFKFAGDERELEVRLRKTDVVCFDLDECLFPAFIQSCVAAHVLSRCLLSLVRHHRTARILIASGIMLFARRCSDRLKGKRTSNDYMMDLFDRAMRGVPMTMIRSATDDCCGLFGKYAIETARLLAESKVTGIVTQSISPIAEQIRERYPFLAFSIGNPVVTTVGTFAGYKDRFSTGPAKLEILKVFMRSNGLHCPMVFGHCVDEGPLVRFAREQGGLSAGVSPDRSLAEPFDVVLRRTDWKALHDWIQRVLKS